MKMIAQIFGALAIATSLIIYSRKTRGKLILFKSLQDIFWVVHYLLIPEYSAAATNGLCFVRESVFYRVKNQKWDRILLFCFLALYLLSAVLTWKNIFSLFPAVSSSISTVAFWVKNPRNTKKLAIIAASCTLVYNITLANSVAVYIGVAFTIFTSVFSLLKKDN